MFEVYKSKSARIKTRLLAVAYFFIGISLVGLAGSIVYVMQKEPMNVELFRLYGSMIMSLIGFLGLVAIALACLRIYQSFRKHH